MQKVQVGCRKNFTKVHPISKLDLFQLSFGGCRRCRRCRYFEKLSEGAENNVTPYHDTGPGTMCHSARPVISPVRGSRAASLRPAVPRDT